MYGAAIQPQATLGLHFAGIRPFPFNFNGVRGIEVWFSKCIITVPNA
jgi:hypothetical protein